MPCVLDSSTNCTDSVQTSKRQCLACVQIDGFAASKTSATTPANDKCICICLSLLSLRCDRASACQPVAVLGPDLALPHIADQFVQHASGPGMSKQITCCADVHDCKLMQLQGLWGMLLQASLVLLQATGKSRLLPSNSTSILHAAQDNAHRLSCTNDIASPPNGWHQACFLNWGWI